MHDSGFAMNEDHLEKVKMHFAPSLPQDCEPFRWVSLKICKVSLRCFVTTESLFFTLSFTYAVFKYLMVFHVMPLIPMYPLKIMGSKASELCLNLPIVVRVCVCICNANEYLQIHLYLNTYFIMYI